MRAPIAYELELELEVFTGPFDLLLTLILKEEVDLLEVDLAEVVVSYIDLLAARGDLDLEVATEFLVLIAALLELKSRLMLPRADHVEEEIEPQQALEELLQRMLDARRFRLAAEYLLACREQERGVRFRSALPPQRLRKDVVTEVCAVYRPRRLAAAIETLLAVPERVDVRHITAQRVTVSERLDHLRALLRAAVGRSITFEQTVVGADRVTVCVTLFALLEMYKRGEASWEQRQPFGEIVITTRAAGGRERQSR